MNIPSLRTWLFELLLHADSDVTTTKYQTLNGQCVIIDELCTCIQLLRNNFHLFVGLSKLVHCIFLILVTLNMFVRSWFVAVDRIKTRISYTLLLSVCLIF